MSKNSYLRLSEITYHWPNQNIPIFDSVSMDFFPGVITTILGPNGAGKTTFLNLMSGRLPLSSGSVRLGEKPISANDFNYVVQDSARLLFPHLTLLDNLLLGRLSDIENLELEEALRILFPESDVLHKFPSNCSGGQRQRAVLCRAIADIKCFPVTLLDEPLSQISHDIKPNLYDLIKNVVIKNSSIILMVTHDIGEALIVGDRTLVISKGDFQLFDTSFINDATSLIEATKLREEVQRAIFGVNSHGR